MMKKISFNKFLLVTLIVAGIYSCKDMMDFHQDYIKNGEIVYLSKLDSMVSYSGKNRIQLSGYLKNAYNVNKVIVYWNNRTDSMLFDYSKRKDLDSLNLMIPNLNEKSYIFDLYTLNDLGNSSIKVSIAGTVYGDIFRSNLAPRTSNGFDFDGKQVKSLWLSSEELERGTQISYTTESSELETVFLSPDSSNIVLPNLKYGTTFSYRSVFVPENTAIDTFLTAWVTNEVKYNPYVGNYHSVGTFTHPTTGVRSIDRDKILKRIDDVTSELELGDMGPTNYRMKLKVNADNSVSLTPSGVTPDIDQSSGLNYYDPATKSFHLNYAFNIAAPRIIGEVITSVD